MQNKYINVETNKYNITSKENNIIGCDSLITCIGILLYSEKYKIAGVLHKSIEGHANDPGIKEINLNLLEKLGSKMEIEIVSQNGDPSIENFKYLIIPPAMYTDKTQETIELFEYFLAQNKYVPFSNELLQEDSIMTIEITKSEYSNCFVFNASTGKFITKEMYKDEKLISDNHKYKSK